MLTVRTPFQGVMRYWYAAAEGYEYGVKADCTAMYAFSCPNMLVMVKVTSAVGSMTAKEKYTVELTVAKPNCGTSSGRGWMVAPAASVMVMSLATAPTAPTVAYSGQDVQYWPAVSARAAEASTAAGAYRSSHSSSSCVPPTRGTSRRTTPPSTIATDSPATASCAAGAVTGSGGLNSSTAPPRGSHCTTRALVVMLLPLPSCAVVVVAAVVKGGGVMTTRLYPPTSGEK